ncbi:MAG: hypothetical protein ACM3O7_03705 [Acidobacteriota bacterium]
MAGRGNDRGGDVTTAAPVWLRPVAVGCGLVALLLVLLMIGGLMSPGRVLRLGVVAIRQRTLRALPAQTTTGERDRLERAFQCVLTAIAAGRLSEQEIAPLGAVSSAALRDGTLTVEEAAAITAGAEDVCRRGGGGER